MSEKLSQNKVWQKVGIHQNLIIALPRNIRTQKNDMETYQSPIQ